jgi:hypothetical protein
MLKQDSCLVDIWDFGLRQKQESSMPNEPQIQSLPHKHRSRFFWILVVIFLIALPALIFYTTGYRLSFENEETSIVTTGGMYVTTDNLEVDVYLNEEEVERPRLFRSAYYIQNITAGQHRIVVQSPDYQTWVKVLPVDSRVVTEVSAFNVPEQPHLRPITLYETTADTPVYFSTEITDKVFAKATSTEDFYYSTSTATTSLQINSEFLFVESLFGTTSTSSQSVFSQLLEGVGKFGFATTTLKEESSTTTVQRTLRGDMELFDETDELYARWLGSSAAIPYYFCISSSSVASTSYRYGEHVAAAIEVARQSTSTPLLIDNNRVCRTQVKLNRLQQDVFYYDFFPNSSDLVLMQLQEGIYVTEIDDRAWQNTQLLYPGTDVQTIVENDVIYIKDGEYYFQIVTEIETN